MNIISFLLVLLFGSAPTTPVAQTANIRSAHVQTTAHKVTGGQGSKKYDQILWGNPDNTL